jgi:hypothetical protein
MDMVVRPLGAGWPWLSPELIRGAVDEASEQEEFAWYPEDDQRHQGAGLAGGWGHGHDRFLSRWNSTRSHAAVAVDGRTGEPASHVQSSIHATYRPSGKHRQLVIQCPTVLSLIARYSIA